jgi:hypothetical protein
MNANKQELNSLKDKSENLKLKLKDLEKELADLQYEIKKKDQNILLKHNFIVGKYYKISYVVRLSDKYTISYYYNHLKEWIKIKGEPEIETRTNLCPYFETEYNSLEEIKQSQWGLFYDEMSIWYANAFDFEVIEITKEEYLFALKEYINEQIDMLQPIIDAKLNLGIEIKL